jgi:hypothetical protein
MRDPDKYSWWEQEAPEIRTHIPRIRPKAAVGIAWGIGLGALLWAALIWCFVG